MKIGDIVTWTSQSQGFVRTKTGVIMAVVPAGGEADRFGKIGSVGMPRNHESYLVRVEAKLYWPRVSKLKLAKGQP